MTDLAAAEEYFSAEYVRVAAVDAPLYERISPHVCRVNLSAWRKSGLPEMWLFRMSILSAHIAQDGGERFRQDLLDADSLLQSGHTAFSYVEWKQYLAEYQRDSMGAVHHSTIYRQQECPSYRIIDSRLMRLLQLLQRIAAEEKRPLVIAIDGRAASGKTIAAEQLRFILGGSAIHMDDFFLPVSLRTAERFAGAWRQCALRALLRGGSPETCARRTLCIPDVQLRKAGVRWLPRGSGAAVLYRRRLYSSHPVFGDYADIKAFSDIGYDEQITRIPFTGWQCCSRAISHAMDSNGRTVL